MIDYTKFIDRKLTETFAKKPRECKLCPTILNVEDPIFILTDVTSNSWGDLICTSCGNRIAELKAIRINTPKSLVDKPKIQVIIEKLEDIIKELRNGDY